MTDDKEERIITKQQWGDAIMDYFYQEKSKAVPWESLPLAPKHTDEEYDMLELHFFEMCTVNEEQEARIKELENFGAMRTMQVQRAESKVKELEDDLLGQKAWSKKLQERIENDHARIKELEGELILATANYDTMLEHFRNCHGRNYDLATKLSKIRAILGDE